VHAANQYRIVVCVCVCVCVCVFYNTIIDCVCSYSVSVAGGIITYIPDNLGVSPETVNFTLSGGCSKKRVLVITLVLLGGNVPISTE
jgi:hypothetical protein